MPAPYRLYANTGRTAARGRLQAHSPHYSPLGGSTPLLYYTVARCDPLSGFNHKFDGFHYSGDGFNHEFDGFHYSGDGFNHEFNDFNHKLDGFRHRPYSGGGAPYQHPDRTM